MLHNIYLRHYSIGETPSSPHSVMTMLQNASIRLSQPIGSTD